MTDRQEDNIFARSAILRWAASILRSEYSSFTDIAAKDVAVLLHAIFNNHAGENEENGGPVVSLHDIQFCDNPTSMTRLLNAKRVLSLVQSLSSSPASTDSGGSGNEGSRLVPTGVGNMTACAWLEGDAFVEELKMWRWIRDAAFKRGLEASELERRVHSFLGTRVDKNVINEEGADALLSRKRPRGEETSGATFIRDMEAAAGVNTGTASYGGRSNGKGVFKNSDSNDGKLLQEGQISEERDAQSLLNITCDGVEAAPGLLNVLEGVMKELNSRKLAGGETTFQHGSDGLTCEPHTSENLRGSGSAASECSTCPSIYASAIQQNYVAIERLESLRNMAVAACLKRDAAGLLGFLSLA